MASLLLETHLISH